jgi:acetyl esterase/lipase
MVDRSRIDAESRVPLDALLEAIPGGFNAIADIVQRREVVAGLQAAVAAAVPPNDRVTREDRRIPGPDGAPDTFVRIYRPKDVQGTLPGIFYIHGGGFVLGSIDGEDAAASLLCERVGAVVVSCEYRLAPENPYPAQVDDCYAGLTWMARHADELDFDINRLAIYGASAGGALCLAMAMMARDRGYPAVSYMMPIFPMLDDRNVTPSSHEITDVGIWDRAGNIQAWAWYLGGKKADAYAAGARATDLSGLPPAYIGVGELDLFRDEDIEFATRLMQAGVPTELHVYPGHYHASEVFAPDAELSQRLWNGRIDALRRALH